MPQVSGPIGVDGVISVLFILLPSDSKAAGSSVRHLLYMHRAVTQIQFLNNINKKATFLICLG